ncbi:MAG: hypothetical protein JWO03_1053, partial [Bacteroidetes bacterium]|nr:hypothetical protein [Bacteroidota bacterium]
GSMKSCLVLLSLLVTGLCRAQPADTLGRYAPWHLTISGCADCDSLAHYDIIYEIGGKHREAHIFTHWIFLNDTFNIAVGQVDGRGLPELIITAKIQGGSGSYGNEQTETRIWNLDRQTEMFAAVNFSTIRELSPSYNDPEILTEDSVANQMAAISTDCSWVYDVDIGMKKIVISHLKLINEYEKRDETGVNLIEAHKMEGCVPDHEEGTYILRKGKFVKQAKSDKK